ncbi:MAG: glycosyltransferase family 2 protein [Gaiellaceae bacterium]
MVDDGSVEVSVVIPCLNEETGIVKVVEEARAGLSRAGLEGEVIVVDNASEDRSASLARAAGARVVHEPRRGYGSAYLAGLSAARGTYIVMTDADGTYPIETLGVFVERLRNGADIVIGNRFRGTMHPGAMPWTNRYIGNPILSGMLNLLFHSGVGDAHCGLRAIRRDSLATLNLSATGMEFASEMVIKAGKRRLRLDELPVDYRPRLGESKLSRFEDAWRHVRFMLVRSPAFLFIIPGGLSVAVGLGLLVYLGVDTRAGEWATGVSMASGALTLIGAQVVMLGLFARTYGVVYLGESDERLERAWRRLRLEHGLLVSGVVLLVGAGVTLYSYFDFTHDPRLGMLGLTLVALGVAGAFASFFLSILGLSEHAVALRRDPTSDADR